MSTVDDIVDAEIVGERTHASTSAELLPVRDLVATHLVPAVETVKANWATWLWSAVKFAFWTFPLDCLRGIQAWVQAWWRWKTLATQTSRATTPGKGLGSSENWLQERRDRRTVGTIVGVLALLGGLALFWWLAPVQYKQYAGVVLVLALFASGHAWTRRVDRPANARPPGYDGSIDSVRRAFAGAKITGKDQSVWYTPGTRPEPVGEGVQLCLDLDAGITWATVAAKKGALGSGLEADSDFIVVEKGRHDGQARLWFAAEDPYRHGPRRSPLLDVQRWSAWEAAPFGRTPHGFEIPLTLMYSNYLGGGLPGSGKSWTSRNVAAPFMLDPDARIFVANGKGCGAWKPLQNIAGEHYIMGCRVEAMERLARMLDMIIDEMDRRNVHAERKGASKVVPEDGFAPWLVIVDELQNYTGCSIPSEIKRGSKTLTWGEVVTEKLVTIAKTARSSAIILALMTQKPGEKSLPTDLRDSIGTRFANRVGNATTSFQILGLTTKDGVDASTLPARHTGIGILVPDAELAGAVAGYPTLRPYTINDADWTRLGERAYALRRAAGTHGYLRLSEQDAAPLPDLLAAILRHVEGMTDEDRVPSRELWPYAPGLNETRFGWQLRRWGAPTGRGKGNVGPSGPLVGDLRKVAQRIREGGPIEVL